MITPPKFSSQNKATRKKGEPKPIISNAREVSQAIIEKRNKQTQHFNKLLELCQQEISRSVSLNFTHCIFEVPEFLIGHPLYDINESIVYIIRKLQENGYKISYYFPKTIYITWPIEETQDDKINNTFLEMLNNIQEKHTYPSNEKQEKQEMQDYFSLIGGLRQIGGLENGLNQQFETFQTPQLMHYPQNINHHITHRPLSEEKVEDINTWMEKNIPSKSIEPSRPINTRVSKKINNDDIKKAINDPFYLLQKEKEIEKEDGLDNVDNISVLSRKSRVSHGSHKNVFEMPYNNNTIKNSDRVSQNEEKEQIKEKTFSIKENEPKSRGGRRKKKEIKPISDLKTNKGFVLDLSQ